MDFLDVGPSCSRASTSASASVINPTAKALLSRTKELLLQESSQDDIRKLKEAAAKVVPQPVSALLKQPLSLKWSRITTGCAALDRCTRGGIVSRGITEICGPSGVGKTQLLMQLSLTVQLPPEHGGLGKGVAFICTEDVFPTKRMFQLAQSFTQRFSDFNINYMANIYIEQALEGDDLIKCVSERLGRLMTSVRIGLIVIDSVAAVFRVYSDYVKRAQDMRKIAHNLLYYADKYNCAVVCVNQVASVSSADPEVPCLGLVWAHLGRTRIKLSRVPKEVKLNKQLLTVRRFEILYSPETPSDFAEFIITPDGVHDVPQN